MIGMDIGNMLLTGLGCLFAAIAAYPQVNDWVVRHIANHHLKTKGVCVYKGMVTIDLSKVDFLDVPEVEKNIKDGQMFAGRKSSAICGMSSEKRHKHYIVTRDQNDIVMHFSRGTAKLEMESEDFLNLVKRKATIVVPLCGPSAAHLYEGFGTNYMHVNYADQQSAIRMP